MNRAAGKASHYSTYQPHKINRGSYKSAPLVADIESNMHAPVLFCILVPVLNLFDKFINT